MKTNISPLARGLLILTVITAGAGLFLVPAGTTLPVHWGPSGEADAFASREVALAMPVVIVLALWAIFIAIERFAPRTQVERSRAMSRAALTMLSAIFLCIAVVTVLTGMGVAIEMVRMLAIGVGLLLLVLGNAMPKSQPNGFAGIRIPSTLRDPANWQVTHRLGGVLLIVGGLAALVAALLAPLDQLIWWLLGCIFVPMLAAIIYSLLYARRA